MLTLWHVGVSCHVSCLVLVVVVCVCPLLASRPVVSECRSVGGVGGVECRSVGFVLTPSLDTA